MIVFMKLLSGLGLVILFNMPMAYATDCTTSFDQSCLSGANSGEQVDADYQAEQERRHQEMLPAIRGRNADIDDQIDRLKYQVEGLRLENEKLKRRLDCLTRALRSSHAPLSPLDLFFCD
jgi:hypothetical protein